MNLFIIRAYTRWAILIHPNISVGKPSTETWFGQKLSGTMGAIYLYY